MSRKKFILSCWNYYYSHVFLLTITSFRRERAFLAHFTTSTDTLPTLRNIYDIVNWMVEMCWQENEFAWHEITNDDKSVQRTHTQTQFKKLLIHWFTFLFSLTNKERKKKHLFSLHIRMSSHKHPKPNTYICIRLIYSALRFHLLFINDDRNPLTGKKCLHFFSLYHFSCYQNKKK